MHDVQNLKSRVLAAFSEITMRYYPLARTSRRCSSRKEKFVPSSLLDSKIALLQPFDRQK